LLKGIVDFCATPEIILQVGHLKPVYIVTWYIEIALDFFLDLYYQLLKNSTTEMNINQQQLVMAIYL
jgi:hypothetical protein